MKKLFLSSSFKDVANLFPEFASSDLTEKTVTFIPTAALHEKMNFYVKSGRKALEKLGLKVDELEISTATQSDILSKLQNNDFIYVSGGNTFFLLQELRRVGADKIIMEQIESGKIYIGESAGSMILSPNIEYVKDMDDYKKANDLTNFNALNIIDFYPLPHYNCFPFQKTVEKIISKYKDTLVLTPINNSQVILINGSDIRIGE
ncbi:Type 1 glutamine amidotransferase-like domain-containing protein [Lachnoclostridium phytofermentans]|uniref:Peptidase S51 dipeptidase E n=1 Tax=Lachnoclostridium phytofermentans (strain ATCC 700394 / DSM 18823 / ISDg) TaxID=357809 RepID=A9KSP3_LACP7|nr:Type 1 glutamine amidotransferase-like domain-containing protein [Lachnoclostridium phytofermentans]ABX43695.1 peptidase S51 dipeptidase E [Lachnoclostridium phytofermentans ISDg]